LVVLEFEKETNENENIESDLPFWYSLLY
jgi:hypothetical protein